MGVSRIFKVVVFCTLFIFATLSAAIDSVERSTNTSYNISKDVRNKATITKSIQSSIRVISSLHSLEQSGITSTSTGTYLEHKGRRYILTAAHSIIGYCEDTFAIADGLMYQCKKFIMINQQNDMALLEVGEIHNRNPIKISQDLYSEDKIRKALLIHGEIVYTGYPQGIGPLTFDGKIVSHPAETEYIYAHTYAWSGSSGSGVFDASGNLVGLITAVSVANSEYGVDVMEDLVIITPISLADVQNIF
jgi:hypothetical protein